MMVRVAPNMTVLEALLMMVQVGHVMRDLVALVI